MSEYYDTIKQLYRNKGLDGGKASEEKNQRKKKKANLGKLVKKIRVYIILSQIFIAVGLIYFVLDITSFQKFENFINYPMKEFLPALYGLSYSFVTNIFLWIGIILYLIAYREKAAVMKKTLT